MLNYRIQLTMGKYQDEGTNILIYLRDGSFFFVCTYRRAMGTVKVLERIRTYFSRLKILLQLLDWLCLIFVFPRFFLSVLSICFSPNKHKILSASFSSSTLKSDVRRKQKCPIFPPVFCFRDGINLREPIICSDLLSILHLMSIRELSIESLWFSRIYLFFSPPSGWLAGCGSLRLWQPGTSAIPPCVCLAAPSISSALSWESLPPHQASQGMHPQGGRGWGAAPPPLLSVPHCLLLAENRGTGVAAGKAIMP